jgi:hypothetical protein
MLRAPIPAMESVSALNEHLTIATAVGAGPVSRASPRQRWPSCLRPRRQSGSARTRSRRSEATATCRNMASSFPAHRLCTTTSRLILPCYLKTASSRAPGGIPGGKTAPPSIKLHSKQSLSRSRALFLHGQALPPASGCPTSRLDSRIFEKSVMI